jgi:hypothetical protein
MSENNRMELRPRKNPTLTLLRGGMEEKAKGAARVYLMDRVRENGKLTITHYNWLCLKPNWLHHSYLAAIWKSKAAPCPLSPLDTYGSPVS